MRAANEDQRIIAADYYPRIAEASTGNGSVSGISSQESDKQDTGFHWVRNS